MITQTYKKVITVTVYYIPKVVERMKIKVKMVWILGCIQFKFGSKNINSR